MPTPAASRTGYELRIEGHLDRHWSAWFEGFAITHEDDGTSTLRGVVADQSELHGMLAKIRDLGATLISVMPIAAAHDRDPSDNAITEARATGEIPC
jgi:hypothetical protein